MTRERKEPEIETEVESESTSTNSMEDPNATPNRTKTPKVDQPRTMKDYALPTIGEQPSAIHLNQDSRNYELKSFHFNMLPSYYGQGNEDPLQFMKEYHSVLETFPIVRLSEDQLRMQCFPYSLKDKAKQWLMGLPLGSITTWKGCARGFSTSYFLLRKPRKSKSN